MEEKKNYTHEEALEICKNNLFSSAMNNMAMGILYRPNWTEEFRCKQIEDFNKKVLEEVLCFIEWERLTEDDRSFLGFKTWGGEPTKNTMIPLWVYEALPKGLELECPLFMYDDDAKCEDESSEIDKVVRVDSKKQFTGDSGVDLDTRMGCIPYRLLIWDKKEDNNE